MTDTTTTTTDPAATSAPAAAAPAAATAAPTMPAHGIAWLPSDADAELIGHVQNAGWQSPADAAKSHRELQKLFGADRHGRTVVLPKDDATPGEIEEFYGKLGRPATAADYKLPVPEGMPQEFAAAAATEMHKLGLNTKQAQALAAWWNGMGAQQAQAEAAAQEAALASEHKALEKDWGTGPDAQARRELARRAAVHLGLDETAIDGIEKTAGYAKTLKALAKVGDMLREAGIEGVQAGGFTMTPEGARAKRAQLMADPSFRERAIANPASSEWQQIQSLDKIIAGA